MTRPAPVLLERQVSGFLASIESQASIDKRRL
jgi:hypothetical protein